MAGLYRNAQALINKGVRTLHPEYVKYLDTWCRCRDVASGTDAVKDKGEEYLPKLTDQSKSSYDAYLTRANFYNATARTIGGLIGMLFRKPPTNDSPLAIEKLLKDVDMAGTPFDLFSKLVCAEVLKVYRVGVLVDYAPFADDDGQPMTLAKAEANNLRPTMKIYPAETIINWKFAQINNIWTLIQVVLKEQFTQPKLDEKDKPSEFENTVEDRYRVLDLDENGDYRVRVFRINNDKDELVETIYPVKNNTPLKEIPFVMINSDGVGWSLDNPPLLDLVDVNLSHYRSSADYEHGCHFTGMPTLFVAGYTAPVPEGNGNVEKITLGSETAIILPDASGKVGFAEFTGTGLGSLVANLDRKEQQMAILGARMIAAEGRQAQTATTTAIHRTGENSILADVSITVSLGLSMALCIFADWYGVEYDCKYQINRDFLPVTVDGQTLVAMTKAWQSGAISDEEFFDWMQRGDIIEAEVSFEDHKQQSFQDPLKLLPNPGATLPSNDGGIKKNPENA